MLNIRENIVTLAIVSTYGIILGNIPHAFANEEPVVQEVIVEADPLVEFEKAKALTKSELKDLLKAVGFEGKALRTAWAVSMKESNGRPKAHNDNINTGDDSYGIFQINMLGSLGDARRGKFNLTSNKELFDPVLNAQIAYYMTRKGEDWSSWKVYPGQTNGERYEQFYALFPTI